VSAGAKDGESSTGRVWAAGVHHVTARCHLADVWKLRNGYLFNVPFCLGPRILNQCIRGTTVPVYTGARLYILWLQL
jgi:hypothetical protein